MLHKWNSGIFFGLGTLWKNYWNAKGPGTESVWEPLQQVFLHLCLKEPRRSSQGRPNPAPAGGGQQALRCMQGTLRHTAADSTAAPHPYRLKRSGCTAAPSQLRACAHLCQLHPGLPGSPLNSLPKNLYSALTSWTKPKASPEASQAGGPPHMLRLGQCPQTKPLIHREREQWESVRASTDRHPIHRKANWAFWVKICMKITPLFPRRLLPATLPPSFLPWSHNPLLVTSLQLIQ